MSYKYKKPERSPEENFVEAIFGGTRAAPICYSYIVEEDGTERELADVIQETLNTLPLNRGRKDPQPWGRTKRILELHFGLTDGRPRTFAGVGRELGMSGKLVQQCEAKALRRLRYPTWSRKLRRFLIPNPHEMARIDKELSDLKTSLGQEEQKTKRLEDKNRKLIRILREFGVSEERFLALNEESELTEVQAAKEELEAFREFFDSLPYSIIKRRTQNTLWKHGVTSLPRIRKMILAGELRQIRGMGKAGESFLRQALHLDEQKASP